MRWIQTSWMTRPRLGSVSQSQVGRKTLEVYLYWGKFYLVSSLIIWMIGQSIPAGIPWMVQTWEEWLVHEWLGHHSKGPQQTEEFSWSWKRWKAEPCIYSGIASLHWVVKQLGREGPWGTGGQQAQPEWCPLAVERANSILGCISNSAAVVMRYGPSSLHCWGHIWSAGSSFPVQ